MFEPGKIFLGNSEVFTKRIAETGQAYSKRKKTSGALALERIAEQASRSKIFIDFCELTLEKRAVCSYCYNTRLPQEAMLIVFSASSKQLENQKTFYFLEALSVQPRIPQGVIFR